MTAYRPQACFSCTFLCWQKAGKISTNQYRPWFCDFMEVSQLTLCEHLQDFLSECKIFFFTFYRSDSSLYDEPANVLIIYCKAWYNCKAELFCHHYISSLKYYLNLSYYSPSCLKKYFSKRTGYNLKHFRAHEQKSCIFPLLL